MFLGNVILDGEDASKGILNLFGFHLLFVDLCYKNESVF